MTRWDVAQVPTIGVLGPRGLVDRLGRRLAVAPIVPARRALEDVDAVVLARSTVHRGGSWEGALTPMYFDRGVALRALLRDAAAAGLPVLLVDDVAASEVDGWGQMLDGAVDDAVVLGPADADGLLWSPGGCWDTEALRTSVGRRPGTAAPLAGTELSADAAWDDAQRTAALAGAVRVDTTSPWGRLLAGELVQLGVTVTGTNGGPATSGDRSTPWEGASSLCRRLGLGGPGRRRLVLVGEPEPSTELVDALDARFGLDVEHVRDGAARPRPATMVVTGSSSWSAASVLACVDALERLDATTPTAVRHQDVVATDVDHAATRDTAALRTSLAATAIDLGGLT